MYEIKMDMIQTIGLAVVILIIGSFIKRKVKFFENYCIPAPVIGGFIFAAIHILLYECNILSFNFDAVLQKFFMTIFFTSIGFNASFKLLKSGGKKVVIFLITAVVLLILQNIVAIGIGKLLDVNPLLSLLTGSTAMTGGHGTSAAIAPLVEKMGVSGAQTVAIAAATFGLVAGSSLGGPISRFMIKQRNIKIISQKGNIEENSTDLKSTLLNGDNFAKAFFIILISMFIGSYLSDFINQYLNFPSYIGAMIIAAIIRNISDNSKLDIHYQEIRVIEEVSLNLFLGMAMMTLKLWELSGIAGSLVILLVAQAILTSLYAYFVTYKAMGSNYDAAVIAAGHIGFGLGATPNGIANMQSVCNKYEYSKVAFFVMPIVGALFIDFFNVSIISGFITLLS